VQDQQLQAQRDAEQVRSELTVQEGLQAYRAESERVLADAETTRLEAEQPLTQQLQAARERIDAAEATRIDRVDVSIDALAQLT
jgi:hypothetical protein